MSFAEQDFILFDVQTTGTNPETSLILEAGWGLYRADQDPLAVDWRIRLLALPESTALPRHIQKLTGLQPRDWERDAVEQPEIWARNFAAFLGEHPGLPILVHYARFKEPFLRKALGRVLDHRVVCSYELSRYALPHLKSFSLRAVAGYAGFSMGDRKRVRDHLIATAQIWRHLVFRGDSEPRRPLQSDELRRKRLNLPDTPGIYWFIDDADRILYVGKARRLKARLNNYFRGRKTKGSRLNEMLTRAVDFRYQTVSSELEALIRENEAIKRHDPPYNRALKADDRRIQTLRWERQLWGPLTWYPQVLPDSDPAALRAQALEALAKAEARRIAKDADADDDVEEERELTEAELWEYLLLRFLHHLERARWYRRLVECEIVWNEQHIVCTAGVLHFAPAAGEPRPPINAGKSCIDRLASIDLVAYDRLAILYNELRKGAHRGDRIRLCLRSGLTLTEADLRHYLPIQAIEAETEE